MFLIKLLALPLIIAVTLIQWVAIFLRPLRKFCVSVFRQNQEYHIINVHDWGLFPLATAFPGGWDGMRALRGVNAVPASRES